MGELELLKVKCILSDACTCLCAKCLQCPQRPQEGALRLQLQVVSHDVVQGIKHEAVVRAPSALSG